MHTPDDEETAGTEVLRNFTAALPPAARQRLVLDQRSIADMHCALESLTVEELARIVSTGIGWNHPANGAALMRYRLARAAGRNDEEAGA